MRKKSFAVIYAAAVLALGMLIPRGGSLLAAETPESAVETAAETTPETTAGIPGETAAAGSGDADTGKVADASEMTEVVDVMEEGMVPVPASELKDGTYAVEMKSSSSMFKADHVELIVAEGRMEAVLYMTSKSYLYMFAGTAEEAAAAGEEQYVKPEEVSGDMRTFTLPVEALDAAGNYAAFSKKKEKWYDRTLLFRADSLPEDAFLTPRYTQLSDLALEDGEYTVEVTLEGGSGKASVASPAKLHVSGGTCTAEIIWSSSNYDYMMVEDVRYDRLGSEEGSVFEIPVKGFDFRMPVQADTTAMSQPYLIDYTLYFDSTTITAAAENAAASVDMGESRGNEEQTGDAGENAGDTGTGQTA